MALNSNQFSQTEVVGTLDLQNSAQNVQTAVVGSGQATPLVAGQPVKLVDSATPIPAVIAATISEVAYGAVVRSLKNPDFPAGQPLELARVGTVIYLEASAAIARGANVQYDPATHKVATKTSTNAILGQAYDKALADGDIIRVTINPASGA